LKHGIALFCLLASLAPSLIPEPAAADTPICEVQDWDPTTGFSPLRGQQVTVTGYVTVGLGILQSGRTSIYITGLGDDDCGINVFSFEQVRDVELGDTVRVTGKVEEYVSDSGYGATTEITFTDPEAITVIAETDGSLPEPVFMRTGDVGHESNEGKLVTVTGYVISPFVGRGFEIDDGTGVIEIFDLPENFYQSDPVWQDLRFGDEVIITGLVSQSHPEMPYLGSYSIIPRSPNAPYEDVKKKECIPGGVPRAELGVSANIFAPDLGETVVLKYNGPDGGRLQLRVFDGKGRLVATLFDRQSVCGEREMEWDGRNEVWEALPAGLYLITLTAEGPEGKSRSMETVPIVIGRQLR